MLSYVLVEVSGNNHLRVKEAILAQYGNSGVKQAYVVTGPYDIIVTIGDSNQDYIASLILGIRKIDGVVRTMTLNAIDVK